MSTGLEKIKATMADFLQAYGVNALSAWPSGERVYPATPVVVVSLRGCKIEPVAFQDYLGEDFYPATQQFQARYGRRAKLSFGLDVYAGAGGEGEMEGCLDTLAQALLTGGPAGLQVEEFSCKEREYDPKERLALRRVEVVCSTCLQTVAQAEGAILEIEIKGGITT